MEMKSLNIKRGYHKVMNYANRNSANILTGFGILGVATTAILTAKETPKALQILEEREEYKREHYNEGLTLVEKVMVVTPVYFPAILMGAATMSCIYGANHINKKQQAVLTSAYSYLNSCYDDYRNKVKELYGDDADKKVKNEIAKDTYEKEHLEDENEHMNLYFDEYSNRYFNMNPDNLPAILYDINKSYNFTGEMSLNNVYEFLGLEPTAFGETVGWAAYKDWECNGFSWIDIHFDPMEFPDNLACGVLSFNIEPSTDFKEWTW